jgi:adenosylcobinamide-phosphate synthase
LGFAADRALGDPARFHPVAGFGRLALAVESHLYADARCRGLGHAALLAGGAAVLGAVVERRARGPFERTVVTAVATWIVLGGRSLEREAVAVQTLLAVDDVAGARVRVRRLVGRDTDDLPASEVARAVIESLAENTSDAVVAPLLWGAVAGVPGLLGYRAANTLDAMVGHHSSRYERYGWASARLDDLLNLPGSRFSGLLVLLAVPGSAGPAWRAWRRDAHRHPSPNAGVVEAAFAGALGIRLGGSNRYDGIGVEDRAVLGDGRAPQSADIADAVGLARRVGVGAVLLSAAAAWRCQRAVRTQSPQ